MGRVVVNAPDDAPIAPFPALAGLAAAGSIETKAMLAGADRPLTLWQHTMASGSEIRCAAAAAGHVFYVWEGAADVDGKPLRVDGSAIVAPGGKATIRAASETLTLLHFHRSDNFPETTDRAGGCVHVVNREDAGYYRCDKPNLDGTIYVDASCPTCEIWLHRNHYWPAAEAPRHFHDVDEIIFITGGTMLLGNRQLTRGTAVAVDADTVYRFGTAPDGLTFVNFRACEPHVVVLTPEGKGPVISERLDVAERIALTRDKALSD